MRARLLSFSPWGNLGDIIPLTGTFTSVLSHRKPSYNHHGKKNKKNEGLKKKHPFWGETFFGESHALMIPPFWSFFDRF